jgi:hypothetical protein
VEAFQFGDSLSSKESLLEYSYALGITNYVQTMLENDTRLRGNKETAPNFIECSLTSCYKLHPLQDRRQIWNGFR